MDEEIDRNRNGTRLNLRLVHGPQYQDKGVDFAQTLTDEPWGAQTFVVRDLGGNLVLFSAPGVSAE